MILPAPVSQFVGKIFPFFILVVLITAATIVLTPQAHAQTYSPYLTPNTDTNVPQNQHTLVQSITIEVLSAVICQLSGVDVMTQSPCLTINPHSNKIGYSPDSSKTTGVIGFLTNSMGSMYSVPVHSGEYIHYMASNFGLTEHAYAQNTGFEQLNYVLRFWKVFRNIAYVGFVIAFVIIGLAIMLRLKIDPRTVMTIQNQLPKILITMLLITFSYAIAGFLVDMMWASTYVVISIADQVGNNDENGKPLRDTNGKAIPADQKPIDTGSIMKNLITSPYNFYGTLTGNLRYEYGSDGNSVSQATANLPGPVNVARRVAETFGDIAGALSPTANPGKCAFQIGPFGNGSSEENFKNCLGGFLNGVINWVATMLVFFIVIVAIIIALARIWIMLLRAFINVIMYTAFAPIYLFAGIFPGSTLGFDPWIRAMVSNLVVFPICVGVLLMGRIFMTSDNSVSLTYAPPLIGTPQNGVSGMGYLVGFAILLITPNLLTMVREALKSNPSKYLAPAIEGGFKAGASGAAAIPGKMISKTFEKDTQGVAKSGLGKFANYVKGDFKHDSATRWERIKHGAASAPRAVIRFATGTRMNPDGSNPRH